MCGGGERTPHLTVTLVSWVTPHDMTAFVPLMTLWSCGALVMRVRAADTQAVAWHERTRPDLDFSFSVFCL